MAVAAKTAKSDTLLDIRNLRIEAKVFPPGEPPKTITLVHDVSLTLQRGKVLGLIGESGAGKSTIGLSSMGFGRGGVRITGGEVVLNGRDILKGGVGGLRKLRGREVCYVAQSAAASFNPAHRLMDQVVEASLLHGVANRAEAEKRAVALFKKLSLPNPETIGERYPHQVSGGQLQRVMTAMALCSEPDLIVFDEPTTALDVTVQAQILDLLKRTQEEHGTAMIFVSHDLAVVSDIADDVAVMRGGHVVEQAPARSIYQAPRQAYTKELLGSARLGGLASGSKVAQPAPPAGPALLSISGVWRSFAGRSRADGSLTRPVLNDISFDIRENQIVGLVGESGSGKSTIGRLVAGLDQPDEGSIALRERTYSRPGRNGVAIDPQLRSQIQMIFQDPYASLNPRRRIRSILAEPYVIGTGLDALAIRHRVDELVRDVELPRDVLDRFPAQLSGGQRQRVAIARAIALEPSLIVADEPVSALDITTQARIITLLQALRLRRALSLLFISHDLGVVSELCDRVVVLEKGVVVEAGETASVFGAPQHPYTRRLLDAIPGKALRHRAQMPERIAAHG